VALYYLQRYDEAVEGFQKATALKPGFVEARVNLRSVFTRLAVYNEALAEARAGNLGEALDRLTLLRLLAPEYLRGRHLEAAVLRQAGRTEEALCAYREILAANPSHPVTHDTRLEMAKILEERGQVAEALQILNQDLRWFRESDPLRTQTMREILRLIEPMKRAP